MPVQKGSKARLLQLTLAVFSLVMLLPGCDKDGSRSFQHPPHAEPQPLLSVPMPARVVETTAAALPIWRDYSDAKPTLVFFSNKTLAPIPRQLREEISALLGGTPTPELRQRLAQPFAPDLLVVPDMAVAAALHERYFSRVVWVVPVSRDRRLEPESFLRQFRERSEFWGENLDTFKAENGRISGVLDDTPVDIVTLDQLPELSGPILLHIDTTYLLPLYEGEAVTPLYGLMRQACAALAQRGYKAWEVTVSHDNFYDNLPLDTRFVATEMARFLADPGALRQTAQEETLRSGALAQAAAAQYGKAIESYQRLKVLRPRDASVYYAEYKVLRDLRHPDAALATLERAVALDAMYAYEYAELVEFALQGKRQDKAVELIDKALAAHPGDPHLLLQKARLLLAINRDAEARPLLEKLAKLPWSSVYYPGMKAEIERLY